MAARASTKVRRRKALLAALARNRGEVDPQRLAGLLREFASPPRPALR